MDTIVIWGAGGHAKVVAASIRRAGRYQVLGFIDDVNPGRAGEAFAGAAVLGDRHVLAGLQQQGVHAMHLAVGHCEARHRIGTEMAALGWQFPVLVDPQALVAEGVRVGAGTYVGPNAVVNADAHLGAHTIVNTAAIVEHDCVIGDAVHLAPRACLAGHVSVGSLSFIGAGAVVRDGMHIGRSCLIGLGAVVVSHIPDGVRAFGNPSRIKGNA